MIVPWRQAVGLLRARRGRAAALLMLAAAVLLQLQGEATPLTGLRHLLFDHYQRLLPRDRSKAPAILVAIDEKSLRAHGQWPWPRDTVAALVQRIAAGQPLAVGLDILFIEPDRLGPATLARRLPRADLTGSPDPDQALAAALAGGPTVLAMAGMPAGGASTRQPTRSTPLLSAGNNAPANLPSFASALVSLPALENAAAGQGMINAPPDAAGSDRELGVLRRLPLVARIGDGIVPTLGLEMVRVALGAGGVAAEAAGERLHHIGVGDYRLPVREDGQVLLHFGRRQGDRHISAADVLAGTVPPDTWRGRFVVIGLTGQGLQDQIVTPLGERIPGADIHLQFIESLLAGDALRRPAWMRWTEAGILAILGLGLIVAVPRLRPAYAACLGAGAALIAFVLGYAAFALGRWLVDSASVVALLNPLFVTLLGNTLVEADQRRRRAETELQASREAAARDAGELDAARRIQMGLLPDLGRSFAADSRLAVAACLEPARTVGGDFYDCFAVDAHHVCLAIGDVSGKGVPASLFMTVTKVLAGALLRRTGDLGEALRQIQAELGRNNPEMMFVTIFVAVLDADSGRLRYVCAGHDAPLLVRDGTATPLDVGAGGPPLCALDDYPFAVAIADLRPGDLLCLFTDGVSEASDGSGFFGHDRLQAFLAAQNVTASPADCVDGLRRAVRRFEAGHPPTDDLSILALRWQGPGLSGP